MAGKKVAGSRVVACSTPGSDRDSMPARPSGSPQPSHAYRRDLRASTVTNSNALKYDSKYHPLDDFTKPAAASKRRKLHQPENDVRAEDASLGIYDSDEDTLESFRIGGGQTVTDSICLSDDDDDEDESKQTHETVVRDGVRCYENSADEGSGTKLSPCKPTTTNILAEKNMATAGTSHHRLSSSKKLPTKGKLTSPKPPTKKNSVNKKTSNVKCRNANVPAKTRLKQELPKLVYYKSFDDLCKKYEQAWQTLARSEDIQSKLKRKSSSYINAWEAFAAEHTETEHSSSASQQAGDPLPHDTKRDDISRNSSPYIYNDDVTSFGPGKHQMTDAVATTPPGSMNKAILCESSPNVTRSVTSTPKSSVSLAQLSNPPKPAIAYYNPSQMHVNPQMLFHPHISPPSMHEDTQYGPWSPSNSSTPTLTKSLNEAKNTRAELRRDISANGPFQSLDIERPFLDFEPVHASSSNEAEDKLARFGVVRSRPSSSGRLWDPAG